MTLDQAGGATRPVPCPGCGTELRPYDTHQGRVHDGFTKLADAIATIRKNPTVRCEFVLPVKDGKPAQP